MFGDRTSARALKFRVLFTLEKIYTHVEKIRRTQILTFVVLFIIFTSTFVAAKLSKKKSTFFNIGVVFKFLK